MTSLKTDNKEQVRVDAEEAPTTQENMDYGQLLEENLGLLRRVNDLGAKVISENEELTKLRKENTILQDSLKDPAKLKRLLKVIMVCHLLLSIGAILLGPYLRIFMRGPIEVWWLSVLGFLWMAATTFLVIATEENNS